MRRVVFCACLLACAESWLAGCADYRQKPTFPEDAAHRAVVDEQALLGVSPTGDALAAQLLDADGEPPQLWLAVFDARGGPTRKVLQAPDAVARNVSTQLQGQGETPAPILGRIVRAEWRDALDKARELGFAAEKDARPVPIREIAGSGGPLVLRFAEDGGAPRILALMLSEKTDNEREREVVLARMPLAGEPVAPRLYLHGGVAWMLSGSYRKGTPLHRAVGLRRADLRRGEAELDNLRGLDAASAGDLDDALEQFEAGIAADPNYADVLYNAASTAALMNDDTEAVAFLARAAAADPARVQVLGRSDPNLTALRKRKDVRDLLGQRRPAPENVSPPP